VLPARRRRVESTFTMPKQSLSVRKWAICFSLGAYRKIGRT